MSERSASSTDLALAYGKLWRWECNACQSVSPARLGVRLRVGCIHSECNMGSLWTAPRVLLLPREDNRQQTTASASNVSSCCNFSTSIPRCGRATWEHSQVTGRQCLIFGLFLSADMCVFEDNGSQTRPKPMPRGSLGRTGRGQVVMSGNFWAVEFGSRLIIQLHHGQRTSTSL